jgi:NAD(P) transhydrogenase
MNPLHYDIIVIGSGPGGEGAAMQAGKRGKSVAIIEKYTSVGGGCTHWGTIPSKALRHAVSRYNEMRNNPLFAPFVKTVPSYSDLLRTAESVVKRQVSMRQNFYNRNEVPVIQGAARFLDPHTIEVVDESGKAVSQMAADYFIIATGSRPYRPPDIDFGHPRIVDADTVLTMELNPRSISIYGAGVIGCEYASIFRGLDVKINLVNTRGNLLEFLDDEISDALSYHLRDQGVLIRHNETYEKVEATDDGVVLHLKSGKKFKTDILLFCNGRTGNTQDMGLEAIGVTPNHRGQIEVNEDFQSAVKHIYAAGDVIGPPGLASAAYDQGRYAARHIVDGHVDSHLVRDIPTGIYTTPEISSIGRTEKELTEQAIPYEVGHAFFKSIARAQITGNTVGVLKILFHRETLAILGIHCFGDQASEIIHIGQAIFAQKAEANTLMYFVNTTFNYPTMAEAYRVAALNGINRVFQAGGAVATKAP